MHTPLTLFVATLGDDPRYPVDLYELTDPAPTISAALNGIDPINSYTHLPAAREDFPDLLDLTDPSPLALLAYRLAAFGFGRDDADAILATAQKNPKFIPWAQRQSPTTLTAWLETTWATVEPTPEPEPNAHLIAAAPDLLEALEEVDKILYHYLAEVHPLRVKIETALAKAKGL